jgi:hypothetical protein
MGGGGDDDDNNNKALYTNKPLLKYPFHPNRSLVSFTILIALCLNIASLWRIVVMEGMRRMG